VVDDEKRRKIIKALNHDFRKRILKSVAGGKVTYTELLRSTGVESGYLAYHLRSMGDLLEKGVDGYTLSPLGVEAYSMLHGQVEKPKKQITLPKLAVVILLVVIAVSSISYAYSSSEKESVEGRRATNRLSLLNHTSVMMEAIVNAFEYIDVPRSVWTDILIHSTQLQKDLQVLQVNSDPLMPTQLMPKIDDLVDDAMNTLSGSDSEYLKLSHENRLLLRDLYGELFDLKKSLR
jgi:DNA-binding transcriptional ArsR family regulator